MSEPTVEPAKVAGAALPEVVQKGAPVPTTTVEAAEGTGNDPVIVEPQNNLTKNFTDAEWKGVKELRVSNVTCGEKETYVQLRRRNYLNLLKRFTDQRTPVLKSGVSN